MGRREKPDTEPRDLELLRTKYLQLARKYAALVARSDQLGSVPAEVVASASGRLATVAAAMIENGVVFHASARWTQMVPKAVLPKLLAVIPQLKARGMAIHELRLPGRGSARLVVRLEVTAGLTLAIAAEEAETWASDGPESRSRLWRGERLRVLGQLAAAVAHDLSSTLRSVRYLLASIENDEVVRSRCGEVMESMARGIEDSSLVVGRLHHFARTGAQPLQPVRLETVIAEAVRLAQLDARRDGKQPQIEVRLGVLPPINGSPGELVHVFLNLLRNGLEAGGGVSITGAALGERVRLVVADHGSGIAAEDLGRIFEPFFTTKGENGSGLGLFIVSTLLQRMGGTVGVANRRGGGALFSVELPIAAFPAAKLDVPALPGARRQKRARR
ncbi:MAG TPA: ATP-binding protein, partial [Myxococcales bacterium]|nr:ATP-binding protein [Myxococcales bacterium]